MTTDQGKMVKKLINCRLIQSTWMIEEVSIYYKTYANLTSLTDAFDQSTSALRCAYIYF